MFPGLRKRCGSFQHTAKAHPGPDHPLGISISSAFVFHIFAIFINRRFGDYKLNERLYPNGGLDLPRPGKEWRYAGNIPDFRIVIK